MAFIPLIDDDLVVGIVNPVAVKFDNKQLEIQFQPAYEPQGLTTLAATPFNTVIADQFGNIQFSPVQGGINIYNSTYLKNIFNTLNLPSVTNNI